MADFYHHLAFAALSPVQQMSDNANGRRPYLKGRTAWSGVRIWGKRQRQWPAVVRNGLVPPGPVDVMLNIYYHNIKSYLYIRRQEFFEHSKFSKRASSLRVQDDYKRDKRIGLRTYDFLKNEKNTHKEAQLTFLSC